MNNLKTNMFIVGAMRSGTSFFSEMLSQHPQIYLSPIKEPHYFIDDLPKNLYEPSRFFNLNNYFEKVFPKPLHIANVKEDEHYTKLFSLAEENHKYRGESSTAYLHAPESAQRIYDYNPEAKIILLFRDPMNRAFSHYKMDKGLGRTTKSFEVLIKNELEAFSKGNLHWNSYLGMSLYSKAIERYQSLFENILIVIFENLINERKDVLKKVITFLEIDDCDIKEPTFKNESKNLHFQKGFYILKQMGLKDNFSRFIGHSYRQRIFNVFSYRKKLEVSFSEDIEHSLREIFIADSKYLENCI